MQVSIKELKEAADLLFDHLVKTGCENVILPREYYWSVPSDAEGDLDHQPSSLTIGQLSDDMNELRRLLNGETEPIAYALVWLSSILRAIGQKVVA